MINQQIYSVPNKTGATNKNINSIGSVIPVKKDVNAPENNIPATNFSYHYLLHDTLLKQLLVVQTS